MGPPWNIIIMFGTAKLEWRGYWLPDGEKNLMIMFSRFDRLPARDRQTDGRTDILRQRSPRYA